MNNQIVNKPMTSQNMNFSMFMTSEKAKSAIDSIVGGKKGQQFITSVVSNVNNNPVLKECTNTSIYNAALIGAALDLSPSLQLGQFYMVPFNKKDKDGNVIKEAQFQIGYKGYIQLAIRSNNYKNINVLAIKEGELISYNPLFEEIEVNLIQDEEERENAKTVGYYAMLEYKNGFRKTLYWSKAKMEMHADKYSQAFNLKDYKLLQDGKVDKKDMWKYSSYWYKDFDGMAFKTMLRQLISKWGMMSIEMQTAYESDMAVIHDNGNKEYVDNSEDYTTIIEQDEPNEEETVDNEINAKEPVMTVNLKDLK